MNCYTSRAKAKKKRALSFQLSLSVLSVEFVVFLNFIMQNEIAARKRWEGVIAASKRKSSAAGALR